MLTHRNIVVNVQQGRIWNHAARDGHETILGALPFFHIYGLTVCMLFSVHGGGTLILQPNPRDIGEIVKLVVKHKVTCLPAVPAMFNGINQFPGIERYDLSTVKVCNSGSAPLPVDVLTRFEELTGAKISEGYGLTETSPVTHSNPFFGTRKVGSIGIPFPDTDCRIVDVEDPTKAVEPGEPGELLVRGPQVMKGYWQKPEETAKAIQDDWFFTGDLARMDEDGFFYIVGRKKDMILVSGYNVYPDEVDRALMGHPAVLEAATIGLPDERRGETVKSFVVKKPGHECTADELVAHCRENLAAYKVPREVEFRDALPKSTVLKILRRQLRDEELEKRAAS
jgi:long-chain acyl-CoA synthetase